jgi:hypothetical protein
MAISINIITPKNLPKTISHTESGFVNNSSIVPCLISSEKLFIVTAGTKKISIHGAIKKKGDKSAKLLWGMLYTPSKIHNKSPFIDKKTAITKYPIKEPKKDLISLMQIAFIILFDLLF